MARKGWEQLTPGYRQRLERAGISKRDYETGTSIRKARGHERTPERPSAHKPSQFPQYETKRQQIINDLVAAKRRFFSDSPKWNPRKARANIAKGAKPLAWMSHFAYEADSWEWLDAIREDREAAAILGYH